jgi:ectoine hydroxylase-related dioxygenase (phytanoyl-CoA dioxygenase family)
MAWGEDFLARMDAEERAWYLDRGAAAWLRKIDQPVAERPAFRDLALDPALLGLVEQLIGRPGMVFFSQIFFKPPGGGGPKPVHQDNFYFGPTDYEGAVTAWIALDEATPENGCLGFVEGSNLGPSTCR